MNKPVVMAALAVTAAAVSISCSAQQVNNRVIPVDLMRSTVLRVMTAAADWQLAHPSKHPPYDWTVAAFYTGMMAFSKVSDSPKYYEAMKAMGERNQWRPGLRPAHA